MMTAFDLVWCATVIAGAVVGIGCAVSDWRDLRHHRRRVPDPSVDDRGQG